MKKEPLKKDTGVRYLKKYSIEETDTEPPIQGQIKDPHDLFSFIKDLHNKQVPKVVVVYLDENHLFLGHQVFMGVTSDSFDTQFLYHYYALFLAKKFIIVITHPSEDATPTEDDKKLLKALLNDSHSLSFRPCFADFIIVAEKTYFSMSTNRGTACHCGHQDYINI